MLKKRPAGNASLILWKLSMCYGSVQPKYEWITIKKKAKETDLFDYNII